MPSLRLAEKNKLEFVLASQLFDKCQAHTSGVLALQSPVFALSALEQPDHTSIQSDLQQWYFEFLHRSTPRAESEAVRSIDRDLGWTRAEAAEIRARLSSFARGWDAPGMEAYDDL